MNPVIKRMLFVLGIAAALGLLFNPFLTSVMGAGIVTLNVTAPYGGGTRPYQDGIMIAGRARSGTYAGYEVQIVLSNTGNESLRNLLILADGVASETSLPGYNIDPINSSNPVAVNATGTRVEGIWDGDKARFEIDGVAPGENWTLSYMVNVPSSVPSDVKLVMKVSIEQPKGSGDWKTWEKSIKIVPSPIFREWFAVGLSAAALGSLIVLGKKGFFRFYLNVDLVSMAVLAAAQTVWVQIIGRQFVFPVLNRVPMTYNFAVGDFPYILLLITAALLVRKPGAVSLTLFVYNIVSEIGWYGLNPLWWPYPFMQGIPADLYMLFRGRGVFTEKFTFFKLRATPEEMEAHRGFRFAPYIDGAVIGFLRGFFMQLTLYVIFYPNLFHLQYDWNYALWWMTIPWAIGNAIEGALSVTIAQKIETAIKY